MALARPKYQQLLNLSAAFCLTWAAAANANPFLDPARTLARSTHLIEVTQDTPLTLKTRGLRYGGFETAQGHWIGFNRWYSNQWNDTRISWLTQLNSNFGLIWGISSGERAEKYAIEPGLRLGFLYQASTGKNSVLTLSGSTMLGGQLKEKTCTADYGDIGGVQKVNCRLAASVLEPSQTLSYLLNDKPESALKIQYKLFFQ